MEVVSHNTNDPGTGNFCCQMGSICNTIKQITALYKHTANRPDKNVATSLFKHELPVVNINVGLYFTQYNNDHKNRPGQFHN